jgi:phosphoglycolate phosphatase-like HAD superfamily hydrolase
LNNLIIFDLDGVITSEEAYWDAAGLTLHELLYSPHYWGLDSSNTSADGQYHPVKTAQESRLTSRAVFPESEILVLKGRSINSNWDTCYVTVCLHLIALLKLIPDFSSVLPLEPWDEGWLARFRELTRGIEGFGDVIAVTRPDQRKHPIQHIDLAEVFDAPIFQGYIGLELINCLDAFASEVLGEPIRNVFSRHSPFWAFCRNIFQEWYLGDALYTDTYGHAPFQTGKPGCISYEKPLLPLEQIRNSLEILRSQGYVLGFATGRVYEEATYPLKMYGLLEYFNEQHISTYDDVEHAETELRNQGDRTLLSKPHPFPFLLAKDRNHTSEVNKFQDVVVVGDSTSDILGGRAAGALTVAVMTGARTPEARVLLEQSNPHFTIEDMTKLPELLEHLDSLATIQHMQFQERVKAQLLLQRWLARHMNILAESVTLTPKAVSLNSFNGFYRSDGEEYFFKTHIEEQGILEEYYNAELLFQAGYNIVRPLRTIHEGGQQMVIYPVIHLPVMFDLMRAVEVGNEDEYSCDLLVAAEKQECARLLDIYQATFTQSTAIEHARAPIHQLYWHRVVGGRFKSYYEGKHIQYPQVMHVLEDSISFNELLSLRWIINGVPQQKTLEELVERAKVVLDPAQGALTVIGHGDAHFGNVFLENALSQSGRAQGSPLHLNGEDLEETKPHYLYFDPAFAGRHSPLLDIIKPLFHNVFATWMYFPHIIAQDLQLTVSRHGMTISVEENYTLAPVRQAILQTKVEHLLRPLIAKLRMQEMLPVHWKEIMQLAMMCCPLLTINLLDGERMPPSISWLGLSLAIQTGNNGIQPWGYEL